MECASRVLVILLMAVFVGEDLWKSFSTPTVAYAASTSKHIRTIEYSFGNSGTTTIASAAAAYTYDYGKGTQTSWSTVAPTLGSRGFTVKIDGTNILVRRAWIELRATAVTGVSVSDMNLAVSTCPGTVASCGSAPAYRDLPLPSAPTDLLTVLSTLENNIVRVNADASAAFSSVTDSEWATGVDTLLRFVATGPTLTGHTAKLYITYEVDYDTVAHYETKTVRFPLNSTTTAEEGSRTTSLAAAATQAFLYYAYLPDLATNSDILDVHFELSAQVYNAAASTFTARAGQNGSTSPAFIAEPAALAGNMGIFAVYAPLVNETNFQPNITQYMYVTPATAALTAVGGELVVTYRYSTDAATQTETIRYLVGQSATSDSTASSSYVFRPVISNAGAAVRNIYVRAHTLNTAATNLVIAGDIDDTGGAAYNSNTYALGLTGEAIADTRIIYDMSNASTSFVSGGPLRVESRYTAAGGDPVALELFITFTWSGSGGGTQTKTVEYFVPSMMHNILAPRIADTQHTYPAVLFFPEGYTKTIRSAYIENSVNYMNDTGVAGNINMGINQDAITSGGTGFLNYTTTGEGISFTALKEASTTVSVASSTQHLLFNVIGDFANTHVLKTVVTYDVGFPVIIPTLNLLHYRWRKDHESEVSAGYYTTEDTALNNQAYVGDRVRLRILLSNTGTGAANSYSYRLEYASSSCLTWSNLGTNQEWFPDYTQYVLEYSSTTDSSGLTNPASFTWRSGVFRAGTATSGTHTLPPNYFTEHEFTINSTLYAQMGVTYCFRLTNAGSVTNFVYTTQPQILLRGNVRPGLGGSGVESGGGGTQQLGGGVGGGQGSENGGGGGGQSGGGVGGGGGAE